MFELNVWSSFKVILPLLLALHEHNKRFLLQCLRLFESKIDGFQSQVELKYKTNENKFQNKTNEHTIQNKLIQDQSEIG